eukprot:CAMPEP_0115843576 /NCGR_PEP_ID=MMETSP0287-20121206/8383_1 /TAXON_ID=412157 /ORGANISM="Chrysochromulina rotalis, Strain UIO044" /LENGTH=52 /DNA_ID=CAMNT_0003297273 /DNA_START=174 /DNA_END=332 /DNA_ORIENTATION=+
MPQHCEDVLSRRVGTDGARGLQILLGEEENVPRALRLKRLVSGVPLALGLGE